jgi:iron complex transport system substrate-binding protein
MKNSSKAVRLVFALSILVVACAAPATQAPAEPTTAAATEAPVVEESPAFPVTIEHKYGSTTITEAPVRVVSVGLLEQDALLALGVVPVATREWYGERPGAIFEWALDELGDGEVPVVLDSTELNFELIASLEPDVIIGLYSGLTQEEYDTLSAIAPTVAQPGEYVNWGIPWEQVTTTVGLILGKGAEAEQLVADVEALFAQVHAEHPEFADHTALIASPWGYPDSYWAYGPQDTRGRLITSLGFQTPPEIEELSGTDFGVSVSRERIDLFDVGVLIWIVDFPEDEHTLLNSDPLYQQLQVVQDGRDLYVPATDTLYDALNLSTVLSIPYAVEHIVPLIEGALDGDPNN